MLTTEKVEVNDNLLLVFHDEVNKTLKDIGKSYTVKYEKYLKFCYGNKVHFDEAISNARHFNTLLEISCGKPLVFDIIYVNTDSKYDIDFPLQGNYVTSWVENYSLNKNKLINETTSHHYMLYSQWNCTKDELKEIIINWFNNSKKYKTIIAHYKDSDNWFQDTDARITNVMFNNRFLNLVQALENYNVQCITGEIKNEERKDFDNKKDKILELLDDELGTWLKSKLNYSVSLRTRLNEILHDIHDITSICMQGVYLDKFIYRIVKYRNDLSHGINPEIDLGEEFIVNFKVAKMLLTICLLRLIGIKDINNKLRHNINFKDSLFEVKFYQRNKMDK